MRLSRAGRTPDTCMRGTLRLAAWTSALALAFSLALAFTMALAVYPVPQNKSTVEYEVNLAQGWSATTRSDAPQLRLNL
jgi:hypothetical protein